MQRWVPVTPTIRWLTGGTGEPKGIQWANVPSKGRPATDALLGPDALARIALTHPDCVISLRQNTALITFSFRSKNCNLL